ncbi:hypothetical protein CEY16_12695 [Halalkalibacillus sediminis]|uniref:DUF4352 domain-containing protein n=1 Tax=Halalkalibacillus sediminis TaxID=2018042 RepID=A0A2I0QQR7_9BACI|nr:DUF4352 domain-containing protein [Halalkalibacillus sediminis]PKR76671.1 hypothetical protein CEY16_12695 [Halalkalibacillus sediminis]
MNKWLLLLTIGLIIMLAACGDDEAAEIDTENEETEENVEEDSQDTTDLDEENTEEDSSENGEVNSENAEPGDTIKTEGGTFELQGKMDEPQTFESGPVVLTIEKVVTVSGTLEGEMKDFMEMDEMEYIQVDIAVENTSDEDITFYAAQGTMSTNTGEQIEPDMWLSDHIEGEMMANTKSSGSVMYVLNESQAADVKTMRFVFDAPIDTDWENLGEKIDFEITIK